MIPSSLKKLIVLLIGLLIAFILAETLLSMRWRNYWVMSGRSIKLKEHIPGINRFYAREGISDNIKGKVSFRTDEEGFILPNLMENKSLSIPHLTIAFLGGSTTECLIVNEDSRFPVLVGRGLKEALKKDMHVINAGCSGDTLQDSVNSLFNKIINYKPDVAVMMHAINDAGLLLVKGNYSERMIQGQDNSFKAIFRILTTKSRVLGFLRDKYAQMAINQEVLINARMINSRGVRIPSPKEFIDLKCAISEFSSRLKVFIDMCNDFGITPVLMTQPFINKPDRELNEYEIKTFLSGMKFLEPFNDEIRKICAEKGARLIDLEKHMPKAEKYFYDEVHFTDEGSILISDIITRHLADILKN